MICTSHGDEQERGLKSGLILCYTLQVPTCILEEYYVRLKLPFATFKSGNVKLEELFIRRKKSLFH